VELSTIFDLFLIIFLEQKSKDPVFP